MVNQGTTQYEENEAAKVRFNDTVSGQNITAVVGILEAVEKIPLLESSIYES